MYLYLHKHYAHTPNINQVNSRPAHVILSFSLLVIPLG